LFINDCYYSYYYYPLLSLDRYVERGAMASMGFGGGIADFTKTGIGGKNAKASGWVAFVAWRGAYLTKQLSIANMILVPMFWFKSFLFGRDISRF
jgi:NADH dehydrogenase FAD-containing subunit